MPVSDPQNLSVIAALIHHLQPHSVLDVGCGLGTYGVIARNVTDGWHGRIAQHDWQTRIEGIEGFSAYRNPIWGAYTRVHEGRIQDVLPTLEPFEVVLMADVIEHFPPADARALVRHALDSGAHLIVSTPAVFAEQAATNGRSVNPYQEHLGHWQAADFPSPVHVRTFRAHMCNVYFASRRPLPRLFPVTPRDAVYLRTPRPWRWLLRFWP